MNVELSVSNERSFRNKYSDFATLSNISISEDSVAYGIEEYLIIGIKFIFESSLSGLTWDLIKDQITPYISSLLSKKKNDQIYISISDNKDEYEIPLPSDFTELDLVIPYKLKLKIKK